MEFRSQSCNSFNGFLLNVQLYLQQALFQEEDSCQWDTRGSDNEGSGEAC